MGIIKFTFSRNQKLIICILSILILCLILGLILPKYFTFKGDDEGKSLSNSSKSTSEEIPDWLTDLRNMGMNSAMPSYEYPSYDYHSNDGTSNSDGSNEGGSGKINKTLDYPNPHRFQH